MDAILNRRPPTYFEQLLENPLLFFAKAAYTWGLNLPMPEHKIPVRIVTISDTHNHHDELPPLPDGDILIHAGDLTGSGTSQELTSVLQWLSNQPHPHKLFIAGNHDKGLSDTAERVTLLASFPSLVYLQESSITVTVRGRALNVYGSPLTPKLGSWPFQYPRQTPEAGHWDKIPLHTDVLITHGPPAHHLDSGSGCLGLLAELWRVRPRMHVFGHIHAARGVEHVPWSDAQAAYERICAGRWRWWDLMTFLCGLFRREVVSTTLVNTACLGGFRRDKERRAATVIDI